ncbi:SURF1 family cytochrome oxidase biogenesis protein [Nocardioides nematodiphilus]|uniref:SURF1 family cytochrome oxidase biogenesis protein n=1 Tax=Nocardioides nematodiphilus TaxID=2849669 RepID=UPI001CD99CA7|nr:SURF1 family protein [Nocardioides nematodiphilus]MCA1981919.1 SURF1 family protein [Nocardioides nematodiphilus]
MRSFRFLLSRRWALFTVAVAILAYGTWWLGDWQWGRLESKHHSNAIITAHLKQDPEPVTDVLTSGGEVGKDTEWTRVSATGTYDPAHTITWRYRTNDHSEAGVDIVVPLITADGTGVLVDRGFLKSQDQDNHPVAVPPPPAGEVTVTGWVRSDATGDSTRVSGLGTRAISSTAIGPAIGRNLLGGWVELESESPAPATALAPNDLPDLGSGPHFFYALQWWFFGLLAVGGFFYLMYDERRLYLHPPATVAADEDDAAPAAPAAEQVAAVRAAASDARKARQREKNARKQALAAAYAKAREADDVNRTKAFGSSVERSKHGTDA